MPNLHKKLYLPNVCCWESSKNERLMTTKGGFFSESVMCFLNLPISKIKIFQKTILHLKFKFPANNIKQQIQI